MIYHGSSISPNLSETDEGYLIALNVPIARTGTQKYLPREVPVDDAESFAKSDGLIEVYREPSEVFSSATIASFEGKPLTEGHPGATDGKVDTSNESFYRKGHMQNIRRGTGDDSDKLLADLFVTNPQLIDAVKQDAKREVSCGYMCDWVPENGKVYQRNIRGNHIAVVPRGRAGSDVAIRDSAPEIEQTKPKTERKKTMQKATWKTIFGLGMKEYVKDAEPDEVSELMEKEPAKDESPAEGMDGDRLAKLEAQVERLTGIIEQLVQSDKEVHKELPATDAMDALNSELEAAKDAKPDDEEEEKEEKSSTIGDEDETEEEAKKEKSATGDSAVEFVKRFKPIVAKMPVGVARDEAIAELRECLRVRPATGSVYGEINKGVQTHQRALDSAPLSTADQAQAFVDKCNEIRNKEGK